MSNLNFKEEDLESRFEHLTGVPKTCPMWNVQVDFESTRN